MILTNVQPAEEIIPGYVLADRLGSGGYAEVWRACAPGGIEKAVKIVHGYHDEELALQELKAMERIKDVRHPFLLSLERFEVVEGRLAILTELADMSLDQRFRACRAEGLSGIPRDELLQYMSDAAEALDYLMQRYGLQHLDIKPENLLILGEHIKVADFGLVKELTSRTQNSLVAGMTPTYSSPEMFDGSPSPHSDQYSLAIVYQEMLVGTLPFPGRTPAQLAKQHTQAAPQLNPLPSHDRMVIARSLAKSPDERFPSCRAFINALRQTAPLQTDKEQSRENPQTQRTAPADLDGIDDDTKSTANCATAPCEPVRHPTQHGTPVRHVTEQNDPLRHATEPRDLEPRESGTQPLGRAPSPPLKTESRPKSVPRPLPQVRQEIVDVAAPDLGSLAKCEQPTLYIAAGGIGLRTLCRLRELMAALQTADEPSDLVEMLALDTDRGDIRQAASAGGAAPLRSTDALHLSLRLPKDYDDSRTSLEWVSRRWLYNIPRSLETRGYRPLGRIALVDHDTKVLQAIDDRIKRLASCQAETETRPGTAIRVVVLAGIGGGTGAGMAIDVANAARSTASSYDVDVEVHGFFACNSLGDTCTSALAAANAFAFLTELYQASLSGNIGALSREDQVHPFESQGRPFDEVYILPLRNAKNDSPGEDALETVAKYLALERTPSVGGMLRACRASRTPREADSTEPLLLRTLGYFSVTEQQRARDAVIAARLKAAVKRRWLAVQPRNAEDLALDRAAKGTTQQEPASTDGHEGNDGQLSSPRSDVFDTAKVQSRFGRHAASRFAHDLVAEIETFVEARDPNVSHEFKDLLKLVDTGTKALPLLAEEILRQEQSLSADIKEPPAHLVAKASRRVCKRMVVEFEPRVFDPKRFMEWIGRLLDSEIEKLLLAENVDQTLPDNSPAHDEVNQGLQQLNVPLLNCGFDRRTLVFVPGDQHESHTATDLVDERPTAAVINSESSEHVIISEGSGICLRSFAAGYVHVYPGIEDAARRLHTRTDIEWNAILG